MNSCMPIELKSRVIDVTQRLPYRRLPGMALGMLLGALFSTSAFAGGADVSADEIYADDVTLTTWDGEALDIDGDSNTDLAVATNRNGPVGRTRYYLGNGDGTFGTRVFLGQGQSSEIVAADLNGDLDIDLVQGRRDLTALLYLGNGGGVNSPGVDITLDANRVLTVAVGDLDGDDDLDLVMGTGHQGGTPAGELHLNRFYLNDGAGTFTAADISLDQDDTRSIALADIDGDGNLDVIVGNDETTPGSNRIYLNLFDGVTPVSFDVGFDFGPADDQTSKILIGDLDNDTNPDIVVLNHVSAASPGINRFFLNASTPGTLDVGTGTDVSADTDNTGGGVLADVDNDGDLDLVVANLLAVGPGESSRNRLYLNQFMESGETAVSFAAGIDISTDEQQSREITAADLNGDDFIDLVVGNQDGITDVSGRVRRYLNNGTADPFTNVAPMIDTQATPLDTDEATDLTIVAADINVTDPDNIYPVDFTLAVQDGTNYTVVANTVTPAVGFDGTLTVPVIVNDGTDDSAPFDLAVTVNDTVNNAPSFTSTPVVGATEETLYTYNITTTDADVSDTVTITAPTLPTWLTTFTDNGDGTATLTGTPADGEAGDYDVVLEASDGTDTVQHAFPITVADTNHPPVIDSIAVTNATEGVAYSYAITATDPDGDALIISAASILPAWLGLTDNGNGTATLAGTPAADDVGDHAVSLQAFDGELLGLQNFTITVTGVTPGNNAPEFTSTPGTAANIGAVYTYDITATDADDGDTLIISEASSLPGWLALTDNGDGTATLTGTPVADDVGENPVALQVTDGIDVVPQDFTITVTVAAPNNPPSFTSTAVIDATAGTTYTYEVAADDDDAGATLEFTAPTLPAWLELIDNGDGTATLTGTPAAGDVGDHDVSLEVSDGTDAETQDFTITVEAATVPPPPPPPPSGGGGGGSLGFLSLLALGAFGAARTRRRVI